MTLSTLRSIMSSPLGYVVTQLYSQKERRKCNGVLARARTKRGVGARSTRRKWGAPRLGRARLRVSPHDGRTSTVNRLLFHTK